MRKLFFFIFLSALIVSCTVEPQDITYGEDKCDNCTMNIVDKPYGTELVTDKGKVYKFDSTECMLSYIGNYDHAYAYQLTNTMDKPGELIDATTCYFLISDKLPSPMGANITAFSTEELAKEAQAEFGGEIYNYNSLKEHHLQGQKAGASHNHAH